MIVYGDTPVDPMIREVGLGDIGKKLGAFVRDQELRCPKFNYNFLSNEATYVIKSVFYYGLSNNLLYDLFYRGMIYLLECSPFLGVGIMSMTLIAHVLNGSFTAIGMTKLGLLGYLENFLHIFRF